MKNIITIIAFAFGLAAAAQQMPEKRSMLALDHEVKIRPLTTMQLKYDGGYSDFYTDERCTYVYEKGIQNSTKPEALLGKVFKIVNIKDKGDKYYILKLEGNGTTLYYKYKSGLPADFDVLNLTLPEDYYCDFVTQENIAATKGKEYWAKESLYRVSKRIENGRTSYAIILEISVDEANSGSGVSITLENGAKIEKPKAFVKIDSVRVTPKYTAIIILTANEVKLLEENKITNFRINNHEYPMYSGDGANLKGIMGCLAKK